MLAKWRNMKLQHEEMYSLNKSVVLQKDTFARCILEWLLWFLVHQTGSPLVWERKSSRVQHQVTEFVHLPFGARSMHLVETSVTENSCSWTLSWDVKVTKTKTTNQKRLKAPFHCITLHNINILICTALIKRDTHVFICCHGLIKVYTLTYFIIHF